MKATVNLSNIVECMEQQTEELHQYLHVVSGKIFPISDEEFLYAEDEEALDDIPDWQRELVELANKILSTNEYIQLPDQSDIHEYSIMERFCLSLADEKLRADMYNSIKGSGAFRRFKENIHHYNIQDDWYQFREAAFFDLAADWCKKHEIPFVDDRANK